MRWSPVTLASWIAVSFASAAQAQVIRTETHRWTVTAYLGGFTGGPAEDIETALRSAGYTDNFGGCGFLGCFPEIASPESYSHANPALLSIRRHLDRGFAMELLLGQAASGHASGRKGDSIVAVDYGGSFGAFLWSVGSRSVRLAAGPALFRGNWTYGNTADGSEDRASGSSLGFVGSAGFGIPLGSRFSLDLSGQYRGFGKVSVRAPNLQVPVIREFEASPSHWYFGAGVGLRF